MTRGEEDKGQILCRAKIKKKNAENNLKGTNITKHAGNLSKNNTIWKTD